MASAPCIAQHPDKPEVHCNRAMSRPHPEHSAYCWDEGRYVSWTNESFEPNDTQRKAETKRKRDADETAQRNTLRQIAAKIRGRI